MKETEFHKDEVVTCHQDDFELKYDIDAFDVSDDYVAVVLYPDFDSIKLCIFDSKMKIINKLSLDVPSGHCGVSIKGKNIVLFPIGTEYATEITQRGELVKMYTYKDRVINGVEKFATRSVEHKSGYTYYLTNNKNWTQKIGQPDSSPYLIREIKSGYREILYDCSKYHNRRTVSVVIIAIAFLAIFGIGGYFQYIRPKRRSADKGNYEKNVDSVIGSARKMLCGQYDKIQRNLSRVYLVDGNNNETKIKKDAQGFDILVDFLFSSNTLEYAYIEYRNEMVLISLNAEEYIIGTSEPLGKLNCPFTDIGGNRWEKQLGDNKATFISDHRNEKGTEWEGMYYQADMEMIAEGIYFCHLMVDTSEYSFSDERDC